MSGKEAENPPSFFKHCKNICILKETVQALSYEGVDLFLTVV